MLNRIALKQEIRQLGKSFLSAGYVPDKFIVKMALLLSSFSMLLAEDTRVGACLPFRVPHKCKAEMRCPLPSVSN